MTAKGPLTHLIPVDLTHPLPLERWFRADRPLEVEIGCGNGRFLAARAARNPDVGYLGIERMLSRVRKVNRKAELARLDNLYVYRLEALYTFHYQIPRHRIRTVYVFFPDPWPKKRHHSHRLFAPLFLDALWASLETGGEIQIATDDLPYFEAIQEVFAKDTRFEPAPPMERDEAEQTDFERLFRGQGLPIHACAYRALAAPEPPFAPLRVTPDMEPKPLPGRDLPDDDDPFDKGDEHGQDDEP